MIDEIACMMNGLNRCTKSQEFVARKREETRCPYLKSISLNIDTQKTRTFFPVQVNFFPGPQARGGVAGPQPCCARRRSPGRPAAAVGHGTTGGLQAGVSDLAGLCGCTSLRGAGRNLVTRRGRLAARRGPSPVLRCLFKQRRVAVPRRPQRPAHSSDNLNDAARST
jgi:hypothetical protein